MTAEAVFVHHPLAERYCFHEKHPFHPVRLQLTMELLQATGALREQLIETPPLASLSLLERIHRSDYLEAVQALSLQQPHKAWRERAAQFGLHEGETPRFAGMHEAALAVTSGSVQAARLVMEGKAQHAFHLAGGHHHAFPERAAGFCIYNDAAAAIAEIRHNWQARVLYIDTDVHHGDGVQWMFYTDADVCTYSIHETGKFLFPGTGFVQERGNMEGLGSCFNVPLEPYTEDESWLDCFTYTIEKIVKAYRPDVIVSQHGCDAHAYDPLSHMQCSMRIYQEMPALIHQLAHAYTSGRWIALGGGGYDRWRVVPRAWALVWLEMSGHPLAAALRRQERCTLPLDWRTRWQAKSMNPLPSSWHDDTSSWSPMPRRLEITRQNAAVARLAVQDL